MCCNVQRAIFAIEYPYPNVSAVIAQDIIGHGSEKLPDITQP